ncbi:MAG: hypothetical protein LUD15_06175 [Bacteroides sp.]|nr:hypothetical protein [Bacteroides sp.]
MKNVCRVSLSLWICCLYAEASDPVYTSEKLRSIGNILAITQELLTPESRTDYSYNSYKYVVETGVTGEVLYIGIPLFPDSQKEGNLRELFNFTERYLLELLLLESKQEVSKKMEEDQTFFNRGNLTSIALLTDSLSIKLSNPDIYRQQIEWKKEELVVFSFSFPARYELISGMNKIEQEDKFSEKLKRCSWLPCSFPVTDIEQLSETPQKEYYIRKGNSYQIPAFSPDLYYKKEDDHFHLLNDLEQHPAETLANTMLSTEAKGDYSLEIQQIKYGNEQERYSLPLKQWITYNIQSGCELYFGLETLSTEELSATVIAENCLLGYSHLLHFRISYPMLVTVVGNIPAVLHTYIPIHNISDLFYENKDKFRTTLKERIKQ